MGKVGAAGEVVWGKVGVTGCVGAPQRPEVGVPAGAGVAGYVGIAGDVASKENTHSDKIRANWKL